MDLGVGIDYKTGPWIFLKGYGNALKLHCGNGVKLYTLIKIVESCT